MDINAVGADQLPKNTAWQWDEIAKMVGSLYLESQNQVKTIKEQAEALIHERQQEIQRLHAIIQQLEKENSDLKLELEKGNEPPDVTRVSV